VAYVLFLSYSCRGYYACAIRAVNTFTYSSMIKVASTLAYFYLLRLRIILRMTINLSVLLTELLDATGYGDTDVSKAMLELQGIVIAPSIVQRMRTGKIKESSWARTNGLIQVRDELLRRHEACVEEAQTPAVPPPVPPVAVKGTGIKLLRHIDPQVAADFIAQRRDKRRPLTDTALTAIEHQAKKAGLTLEQALRVCCENGWMGFNAQWYERLKKGLSNRQFSGASFVLRDLKM
jgi:hypothetical protein